MDNKSLEENDLPVHVTYYLVKWGWSQERINNLRSTLYEQRLKCDAGGHIICKKCGKDHCSLGLCKNCYQRQYRALKS